MHLLFLLRMLNYLLGKSNVGNLMTLNKAFALKFITILSKKQISNHKFEKETKLTHSALTHSALRHIFNENNKDVKFSTIVKVCSALKVPLTEFFNDELFNFDNLEF